MKKIFNTISVLLLLQSAAYAQQPAHRTTATKVADVLAQQPAEEINKFLEVMKQLEGFSEADVVGLLSGLKPQGQDNAGLEYARNRKSTRLNSSHVKISYAVFCLKKKNGAQ